MIFSLALFLSAALTFTLQPLFARMVTPILGGSPAVRNTAMVFFQGALLVRYGSRSIKLFAAWRDKLGMPNFSVPTISVQRSGTSPKPTIAVDGNVTKTTAFV